MDPSQNPNVFHATTIVCVRRGEHVAIAGDGQVTLGHTVMKGNARKVRRLGRDGQVLAGFAGAAADAFTLFELFEAKLEKHGQLQRAAVELAKDWRTDRYLRRLEAMMAVADADNLITVYHADDFSTRLRIDNHSGWVMALAFSPDGKHLASASRDRTAKIFELKSGETISTYGGHTTPVQGVAFRGDGKAVFSTDRAGAIHVWKAGLADIAGKRFGAEKISKISNLGRDLYKLYCHGNALLSHGSDGSARLFQASDRKPMRAFAHAKGWLMAAAWNGTAGLLATGAHDGSVCIWKIADGKLLKRFTALPR